MIRGADVEPVAPIEMWLPAAVEDLVPNADPVFPTGRKDRTPDPDIFLAYFEKGRPRSQVRGARLNSLYYAQRLTPATRSFQDAGEGRVRSSRIGIIMLPDFPAEIDRGRATEWTTEVAR